MIENIRKYTGLIIVVIVVLLLGFVFMDTSGFFRTSAAGATYATVDGRGYSQKEFNNIGRGPMQLCGNLQSYDEKGLEVMRFASTLAGNAQSPDNAALRFFAGRLMIREARDEFGVHPSDEEVNDFITSMGMFRSGSNQGPQAAASGEFEQESYNQFVNNVLGRFGLLEADFQDLVRDIIATSELRTLIGGGLSGSRHVAEAMAVVNSQMLEADVAEVDRTRFLEEIEPTEEDLKSYWEDRKDAYQTEKQVKLSYLLLSPEYPEAVQEEEETEGSGEEDGTAAASGDDDTAEDEAKREEIDKALAREVNDFVTNLMEAEGGNFESLIEENTWELKSTDWVTRDDLPDDLQLQTRGASSNKSVPREIFSLRKGSDPLSPFTNALAVGDAQWLMVRLDEVEEAREKTFEEAREEVREQYIEEQADETLREEVKTKVADMEQAIEDGRSFPEAAESVGLEARSLGPWSASDQLDNEADARAIFDQAATTNPGDFADPLYQDDRVVIIRVTNREIVKSDSRGGQIDSQASRLEQQTEIAAFTAWLDRKLENARVEGPEPR